MNNRGAVMPMAESAELGAPDTESLDFQSRRFTSADEANTLGKFRRIVEALRGLPPGSTFESTNIESWDGYYFRASEPNLDGPMTAYDLKNGVAISHNKETSICRVEAMLNQGDDPTALDSMYYLWLSRIIPTFSRVVDFQGTKLNSGVESSGIYFPRVNDDSALRLLTTFGLKDKKAGWYMPIPQTTVIPQWNMLGWMNRGVSGDDVRTSARVSTDQEGNPIETRFFENGEPIGQLMHVGRVEALTTAAGKKLPYKIPDCNGDSSMLEAFSSHVVRRQLGLVTLKRALATEE